MLLLLDSLVINTNWTLSYCDRRKADRINDFNLTTAGNFQQHTELYFIKQGKMNLHCTKKQMGKMTVTHHVFWSLLITQWQWFGFMIVVIVHGTIVCDYLLGTLWGKWSHYGTILVISCKRCSWQNIQKATSIVSTEYMFCHVASTFCTKIIPLQHKLL